MSGSALRFEASAGGGSDFTDEYDRPSVFYVSNMETGDVNVVYVRKDGTYGLLEPAEE